MSEPEDFFAKVMLAVQDYQWAMDRDYARFEPPGWLIITKQQKRDLLYSPAISHLSQELDLFRRVGALGAVMGLPIHIASPGDKVPDWLYGRFTVDMRGDQNDERT